MQTSDEMGFESVEIGNQFSYAVQENDAFRGNISFMTADHVVLCQKVILHLSINNQTFTICFGNFSR